MLPVWIISLTRDSQENSYLNELISGFAVNKEKHHWYYSSFDTGIISETASVNGFLKLLAKEGQNFYNQLQKDGAVIQDLQICVTGNIEDELTRSAFQLLPAFLRSIMPTVMAETIYRGYQLSGFLYIPHNLNHLSNDVRMQCALFIEELKTMTNMGADYYQQVIIYQNVQNANGRTERYYPELNNKERIELLFQYLINLYFKGKDEPSLFGNNLGTTFYALGATSVYYNNVEHRETVLAGLFEKVIAELKNPEAFSEEYSEGFISLKFPNKALKADTVANRLQDDSLSLKVDTADFINSPEPHPVKDFWKAKLYLSYYLDYLRFMPARASEFARAFSYMLVGKFVNKLRQKREVLYKNYCTVIDQFNEIFHDQYCEYPTITQLKNSLEILKGKFESEKREIEERLNIQNREIFSVPKYLQTYYDECKTADSKFAEKTVVENMKTALQGEPTIMALLSRCFLLGIALVFVLLPVLKWLSPFIINLGNVTKYQYIWAAGIFLLPFAFQFGIRLRRHFLFIKKQKYILLAHALRKSQKKAAAQLYTESVAFYENLIKECEARIQRCEEVAGKITISESTIQKHYYPVTKFNQPLVGGKFSNNLVLDINKTGDKVAYANRENLIAAMKDEDFLLLIKELTKDKIINTSVFVPGNPIENIVEYTESIKTELDKKISIRDYPDISKLLNKLYNEDETSYNILPLFRMAEANGTVTDHSCQCGNNVRCGEKIHLPVEYNVTFTLSNNPETQGFIFVTSWAAIQQLNSYALCGNINFDVATLPFSTRMVCYYAFYEKDEYRYHISNKTVNITLNELEEIARLLKDNS